MENLLLVFQKHRNNTAKLKELLVEEANELDEGWKGALSGLAIAGAAVVNTPPVYVDGERYEYATASAPANAKLVKTDDGKKVKVWTSPSVKQGQGNNGLNNLYRPAE